jgi:uncharacterized membrane protein YjjP (DUF1212 family)|tara:strand:+ start:50 stop:436 length:387 start_codon:yes stop_codon:yes gene_type:complete
MAKHKRWSDKPKSDVSSIDEEKNVVEQETSIEKESKDIKSLIVSGTKYIYIVAAAALLSGIFTPLTIGEDWDQVIFGMLSIFLGLGGGVVIYLGVKTQKLTIVMVSGGLAMMFASLVLIYEFAFQSLF